MSNFEQYELNPVPDVIPVQAGDQTTQLGKLQSLNFRKGQKGWQLDDQGNAYLLSATIVGAIMASSIDIPDTTTANSFHVDSSGNAWWGATTLGAAPASVTKAGAANFTSITISGYATLTKGAFGGNGADGALSVSSGTTTIDLGAARYFVKNYSSISITGTGAIQFTNPHANGTYIVIKCSGACTLTSSATIGIDCTIAGATKGAATTATAPADGADGTNGQTFLITSNKGLKATSAGPTAGNGGATGTFGFNTIDARMQKYSMAYVGAGGASGAVLANNGASCSSGAGGTGGGALIMEVAGALNFTAAFTISCAGSNGGTATQTPPNNANGGGGGGGGGGFFLGLYNSLTANSGTVSVAGGTGGNNDAAGGGGTRAGGGGGGSGEAAGSNGSTGGNGSKTGGDGAAGKSFGWIQNTDWF